MDKQRKIDNYYAYSQGGFEIVSQLSIVQDVSGDNAPGLRLKLELASLDDHLHKLFLEFRGVRNLKLKQPSWSIFKLQPISIVQITDRQWETLNYLVKDDEDDSLEFECADFDFRVE